MKRTMLAAGILTAALSVTAHAAEPASDNLLVASPFARAVPAMQANSAVFFTLKNFDDSGHAIVSASSRAAKSVELHTHIMDNGVARMREVPKIDVPANGSTQLKPGGLHVMLLGLKRPLVEGSVVPVTLTFDDGSTKSFNAPIQRVMRAHAMHGKHGAMAKKHAAAMKPAEAMDPVFVNLTTEETWQAGMAVNWAKGVAKRGHRATIFLNVDAVRLASTAISHEIHTMQEKSVHELLKDAMDAGVTVLVCGGCLKRSGLTRASLMEGVQMAHPNKVMAAMFEENSRVISW